MWFDASDLNADGTIDTNASGDITLWKDKSGNNKHTLGVGTAPSLTHTSGQNGKQRFREKKRKWRIFKCIRILLC